MEYIGYFLKYEQHTYPCESRTIKYIKNGKVWLDFERVEKKKTKYVGWGKLWKRYSANLRFHFMY